jgi:hypothetical protein
MGLLAALCPSPESAVRSRKETVAASICCLRLMEEKRTQRIAQRVASRCSPSG